MGACWGYCWGWMAQAELVLMVLVMLCCFWCAATGVVLLESCSAQLLLRLCNF